MINLIYLCFYADENEKNDIFNVMTDPEELTNYCQESVKGNQCLELIYRFEGVDLFEDNSFLSKAIFNKQFNNERFNFINKSDSYNDKYKYIKVIKLVNKYFRN